MIRRLFSALLIAGLVVALLLAGWPQALGAQYLPGVAQLVSLRGIAVLAALAVALLLGLASLVIRRFRPLGMALVTLLLVFSVASTAVLASRGFGGDEGAPSPDALVVLSWNTYGDSPGARAVADLAEAQDADVITLPETSEVEAQEVAALLATAGRPMAVLNTSFDLYAKTKSTSLLISTGLGEYVIDDSVGNTSNLPIVVAVPADGTGPTIVSAHPTAPVPDLLTDWQADLRYLAALCAGGDMIMAGDFNSTVDHYAGLGVGEADLGHCTDGASAAGAGGVGTWPTSLPPLLGTPIDHVFTTSTWRTVSFAVIESEDDAGSDHRPVVAHLEAVDG